MKIRRKILLLLTISAIPVIILSFLIYHNITKNLIESQLFKATQSYNQVKSFLDYRLEQIFMASHIIALDSQLNEILTKDPATYPISMQLSDMSVIKTYIEQFRSRNNLFDNLRLYVSGSFIYSNDNKIIYNLDASRDTLWYKNTFRGWGWLTYNPPAYVENNNALSIVRPIRDLNQLNHFIGAVRIDISVNELNQILSRANITSGCLSYIMLNDNLVAASEYELLETLQLDKENLETALLSENNMVRQVISRENIWTCASYLNNTDLILVTVLPEQELAKEIRLIQTNYIIALSLLFLLTIITIMPIMTSITQRIKQLVDKMKLVQEGNLDVKIHTRHHDEIGILVDNFNFMIEKINELMKKQYMLGQELKSAELKALQSQINPHFLYNTLEMLGWMAYKSKPKEIQAMTCSLAQFYRLSLNHGNDITSVSNELELVKNYLFIQSARFRNNFSYVIDVEGIEEYSIPKITLQPIVENSILHGILEKENKCGTIKIRGRLNKDIIVLIVEDDGIGMGQAQIDKIMRSYSESNCTKNYGLRNIEMRLRLYFGIKKAIKIKSKPGVGTKVIITIPAIPYQAMS